MDVKFGWPLSGPAPFWPLSARRVHISTDLATTPAVMMACELWVAPFCPLMSSLGGPFLPALSHDGARTLGGPFLSARVTHPYPNKRFHARLNVGAV